MNSTEFYRMRRAKGLCVDCGKPMDREGARCAICLTRRRQETNADRSFYKSIGICPRCQKNRLYGSEQSCPECRARAANDASRRRGENRMEYNGQQRIYHAELYRRRKESGICVRCGKRMPEPGYAECGICRYKDRMAKQIRSGKPDRGDRYLQGLCYFCDNPVKAGYKVCEKHYRLNVENARSRSAVEGRRQASALYGWDIGFKGEDAGG